MAREIPSYVSQLQMGSMPQVQFTDAGANATRKLSAEMGVIAEDMQRKNDEIYKIKTETQLKTELHRINEESGANPEYFKQATEKFRQTFVSNISDSNLAARIDAGWETYTLPYLDKITEKYKSNLDDDYKVTLMNGINTDFTTLQDQAKRVISGPPEARAAAMKLLEDTQASIQSKANVVDSDGKYIFGPEIKSKLDSDSQELILKSLPSEARAAALGIDTGEYEDIMTNIIFPNEGWHAAVDGNTGGGAIVGITEKWWPNEYNAIISAAATKGRASAEAMVRTFYKKNYWDKYGIGELPPAVRGIVMDGIINHRTEALASEKAAGESGFVSQLVAAAKSRATVSELLEMRQAEYDRLAATGTFGKNDVASWNRRLEKFEAGALADKFALVDPAVRQKLTEETQKEIAIGKFQSGVMSGQVKVDAADKDQRALVNDLYDKSGLLNAALSGDAQAMQQTIEFVNKTTVVPEKLQSSVRAMIYNGDDNQKQAAYGLIGKMQAVNPSAITGPSGFSESEVKDAAVYNQLISANASPSMALKSIADSKDPSAIQVRSARSAAAEKLIKDLPDYKVTDGLGLSVLGFEISNADIDKATRDEIIAEYKAVYKESYLQYGDDQSAHAAAKAAMSMTTGKTFIGGKERLMKFAPEMYFGPAGLPNEEKTKYIEDQLLSVLKEKKVVNFTEIEKKIDKKFANAAKGQLIAPFGKSDIDKAKRDAVLSSVSLLPLPQSKALIDAGKKPRYALSYVDSNGVAHLALDKNNKSIIVAFDDKKMMQDRAEAMKAEATIDIEGPSYTYGKIGQ